ncbi:DUF3290 domain-containing protein [Limosilactobacillus fermentum]
MDFYTYHYLQVHQQAFTLVGYGITIAASLLVLYYSGSLSNPVDGSF